MSNPIANKGRATESATVAVFTGRLPDLYDENAGMAAYRRKLMGLPRDPSLWDSESIIAPVAAQKPSIQS